MHPASEEHRSASGSGPDFTPAQYRLLTWGARTLGFSGVSALVEESEEEKAGTIIEFTLELIKARTGPLGTVNNRNELRLVSGWYRLDEEQAATIQHLVKGQEEGIAWDVVQSRSRPMKANQRWAGTLRPVTEAENHLIAVLAPLDSERWCWQVVQ